MELYSYVRSSSVVLESKLGDRRRVKLWHGTELQKMRETERHLTHWRVYSNNKNANEEPATWVLPFFACQPFWVLLIQSPVDQ